MQVGFALLASSELFCLLDFGRIEKDILEHFGVIL